nr:hypothetical protein [Tanacetum cinerariifolium]
RHFSIQHLIATRKIDVEIGHSRKTIHLEVEISDNNNFMKEARYMIRMVIRYISNVRPFIEISKTIIEVTAEKELKNQVTMAVPMVTGEGYSMAKMDVVYEWKPSRCDECLVFGHMKEQCPKRVSDTPKKIVAVQNDGFTTVVNRKNKGKATASQKKHAGGFKVSNTKLVYQPVKPKENALMPSTSESKQKEQELEENGENNNGIKLHNLFDKLNDISYQVDPNSDMGEVGITSEKTKPDEDSNSEVEESEVRQVVSENNLSMCAILESHVDISALSSVCSKVEGHSMFQVTQKMKNLKKPLWKLLHDQGNLHDWVNRLRVELDVVQKALDSDPSNSMLRDEEAVYIQALNDAIIDEERFLRQKAKIQWLDVGDSNSAYFHKTVKSKNQRNRIEVITNSTNAVVTGNEVP